MRENWNLTGVGFMGYSARYNQWLYRAQSRAMERLLNSANIRLDDKEVLDVGNGIGYWLNWFQQRDVAGLFATELSRDACQRLESEFPEVTVRPGDITDREWSPGTFDLVNVISVMFHIVEPVRFETALQNISNAVKPDGWLVVSDALGVVEKNPAKHAVFRPLHTYESQLAQLGFTIRFVEPMYTLLNGGVSAAAKSLPAGGRNIVRRFENLGAPLLYALDLLPGMSRLANMRVIAAQRE